MKWTPLSQSWNLVEIPIGVSAKIVVEIPIGLSTIISLVEIPIGALLVKILIGVSATSTSNMNF